MKAPDILLHDIERASAPAWWPPAPGWWVLALVLLPLLFSIVFLRRRQLAKRAAVAALFEQTLAAAQGPARVIALATLLRRAARQHHPGADTADDETWLTLLDDGMGEASFRPHADLLLRGGYRREVDAHEVEALCRLARRRFFLWMGQRP